jgi:probable rRNA maturation factor
VSEAESQSLNNQYRKKNEPTNVLSFLINNKPLLGDIILCHSVIKREALEQRKRIEHHYAHLIIHGYLHLLGFNHTKNDDAVIMENKEIYVLKKLGINNPYMSNIMK